MIGMADTILKHEWLKLSSRRTQPYIIEDVSVIIPSTAKRFNKRLEWFWSQFVAKTDPQVVEHTIIPCDPSELDYLKALTQGRATLVPTQPRYIVNKTLSALEIIKTRLTFRLANDIMVVREGWEKVLVDQFNAEEKLQIIGEGQHGTSYPDTLIGLQRDWEYLRREYPRPATAAVYLHGSRLFAQTAVWRAYYSHVRDYTAHDHDELVFSQIARGDGTVFVDFRGLNSYLCHIGITNKDFTDDYITSHIERRRKELEKGDGKFVFHIMQ